jgi:ribosome-associated heat shock protein Hsp15
VEGGKVDLHPDGATSPGRAIKPKVSKELSVGDLLTIRRGWTEETVVVRALSEARGNATAARTLYEETEDSVIRRQAEVARRRMERAGLKMPERRPSKRDRRALKELKEFEP